MCEVLGRCLGEEEHSTLTDQSYAVGFPDNVIDAKSKVEDQPRTPTPACCCLPCHSLLTCPPGSYDFLDQVGDRLHYIDPKEWGSMMRFVNDSQEAPNLSLVYWPPFDEKKGVMPRRAFLVAQHDIDPHDELTFDYGRHYARHWLETSDEGTDMGTDTGLGMDGEGAAATTAAGAELTPLAGVDAAEMWGAGFEAGGGSGGGGAADVRGPPLWQERRASNDGSRRRSGGESKRRAKSKRADAPQFGEEGVYEVERVVAERLQPGSAEPEFLVRWKGYSRAHDSWEPAANLHPDLVQLFHAEQGAKQGAEQSLSVPAATKRARGRARKEENALVQPADSSSAAASLPGLPPTESSTATTLPVPVPAPAPALGPGPEPEPTSTVEERLKQVSHDTIGRLSFEWEHKYYCCGVNGCILRDAHHGPCAFPELGARRRGRAASVDSGLGRGERGEGCVGTRLAKGVRLSQSSVPSAATEETLASEAADKPPEGDELGKTSVRPACSKRPREVGEHQPGEALNGTVTHDANQTGNDEDESDEDERPLAVRRATSLPITTDTTAEACSVQEQSKSAATPTVTSSAKPRYRLQRANTLPTGLAVAAALQRANHSTPVPAAPTSTPAPVASDASPDSAASAIAGRIGATDQSSFSNIGDDSRTEAQRAVSRALEAQQTEARLQQVLCDWLAAARQMMQLHLTNRGTTQMSQLTAPLTNRMSTLAALARQLHADLGRPEEELQKSMESRTRVLNLEVQQAYQQSMAAAAAAERAQQMMIMEQQRMQAQAFHQRRMQEQAERFMRAQQQAQQTRAAIAQQQQPQQQPQEQQAVAPQTAASRSLPCARDTVLISGLQSRPELNGTRGIVESYLTATGRWQIRLEGVGAPQSIAIRPENLTVVRCDASAPKATANVAAAPPATEHAKAAAASVWP